MDERDIYLVIEVEQESRGFIRDLLAEGWPGYFMLFVWFPSSVAFFTFVAFVLLGG